MRPVQAKLTHYQRLMLSELSIAAVELRDLAGDHLILASPVTGTVMLVSLDDLRERPAPPSPAPKRRARFHLKSYGIPP